MLWMVQQHWTAQTRRILQGADLSKNSCTHWVKQLGDNMTLAEAEEVTPVPHQPKIWNQAFVTLFGWLRFTSVCSMLVSHLYTHKSQGD